MPHPIPNVIDLSHIVRVDDFKAAKAAGLLGAIHKATTGTSGTDPLYCERRAAALAAGLLWGAYHWGSAADPEQQVEHFLGVVRPDDETLVALDFERCPGDQMSLSGAKAFLQGVERRLGRKAVLYSGETIKAALGETCDAHCGSHRLWLPQYGSKPVVQASWPSFWLWQYTDGIEPHPPGPASIAGIPGDARGHLDCDYFPGSEADLKAQWAS